MDIIQDQKKRVSLVTGSTSGIGLAIAKQLANDGFTIAFHCRSSVDQGQALAESYPHSSYTQADLSQPDQVRHLMSFSRSKISDRFLSERLHFVDQIAIFTDLSDNYRFNLLYSCFK